MVNLKKKCPYCGREIGKAGWTMHMGTHVDKEDKDFVAWSKVGEQASGGEQSFRGEGGGKTEGGSGEKEFWEETFGE